MPGGGVHHRGDCRHRQAGGAGALPNVVADHQTKNARVLANAGGAVLLPEGESSGEKLYALMTGLLSDAPRREAMSRALRDMAVPDAAEQIYQTLVRLMEKRAN